MLADIALDVYSVIPFVTWRGKTEDMNIFALLCHLWRNQEKSNGVKRAENGCAVGWHCFIQLVVPGIISEIISTSLHMCLKTSLFK